MNLSDFRLLKEDDHHYEIGHPKGKSIKVSKKDLSDKAHGMIKKMASGGEVSSDLPPDLQGMISDAQTAASNEPTRAPASLAGDVGHYLGNAVREGVGSTFDAAKTMLAPVGDAASGLVSGLTGQSAQAAQAQPAPSQSSSTSSSTLSNPIIGQRTPAAPSPNTPVMPSPSYGKDVESGYQQHLQGLGQEAAAIGQLGKEQANVFKDAEAKQQELMNNYQTESAKLNQDAAHTIEDIKAGHIDPSHYWSDKSTGAKVASAIGLILGGIGGGLTHQENPALKFLNSQIDRDMDAQKAELGKKENILGAYYKQLGNLQAATTMSKAFYNDLYASKLEQAAAQAKDPIAKAQLNSSAGEFKMNAAQLRNQIAVQSTMMHALNQGGAGTDQVLQYMRMFNPQAAKEMESRYVPGIGVGSVPLDDKTRGEIISRDDLQNQIQNLRTWAQQHSGSLSPSDQAYGKALANQVQDAYRRANGQGVFREAEADFVKGIVEQDPTKFFNSFRVDPKYKALEDTNLASLNHTLSAYGFKPRSHVNHFAAPSGYKRQ